MASVLISRNNKIFSAFLCITVSLSLTACGGGGGSSDAGSGSGASTDLTLGLPLKNYSIDADSIVIDSGSGVVHASIGPFGAHFNPLTGHTWGDAKGNIAGYMARSDSELSFAFDANGNGLCEPGDTCGFAGGVNGIDLLARQPTYVAPVDATVTRVSQDIAPNVDSIYLNKQPHWSVVLMLNSRYQLAIGHIGSIATQLHDKILAATGIDTDTYTAGDGVNLVDGVTINVLKGDELAHPQLVASEVTGYPDHFNGSGLSPYPWSQIEYGLIDNTINTNVCYYDLLSDTEKASLSAAMIADMTNTTSPRYGFFQQTTRWKWGAEAVLCPAYSPGSDTDFSDIHTHLGGWTERPGPGLTRDELFSIVKIQTVSAMYDAANYGPGVTHLVVREDIVSPNTFDWTMPDMTTPTDIFYPAGEVLEETANTLSIKWRDFSNSYISPVYQKVAYQLDSNGLKVKWGNFAASSAAAMQPVLGADACNDTDVICYDHRQDIRK